MEYLIIKESLNRLYDTIHRVFSLQLQPLRPMIVFDEHSQISPLNGLIMEGNYFN